MPPPWWVWWQRGLLSAVCGAFFGIGFCWMSELNWSPWLHNMTATSNMRNVPGAVLGLEDLGPHHNSGDTRSIVIRNHTHTQRYELG